MSLSYHEQFEENKKTAASKTKIACNLLYQLGITKVDIRYSGSGDSGQVEEVSYFMGKRELTEEEVKKLPDLQRDDDDTPSTFSDAWDWATNLIDGDWYNNEGGQGDIIINTKTGKYTINAEFNITDVKTETQEGVL